MKYHNLTDKKLVLSNIGEVEPDGFIESETPIENPNLEEVKTTGKAGKTKESPEKPVK